MNCSNLIQNTPKDGHITSVFYDSPHHSIFSTSFSNKEYPILFSIADNKITSSPLSSKAVHAAQSPSGSRYAIATETSEIDICDYKPDGTLNTTRIKRATSKIPSSAFRSGKLSLSFLQENVLIIFWIKDERLTLRTIRLNEAGEVVNDYDLKADFERLMTQRVATASSRAQSPGPSLLSGPLIVQMEGSPVAFRPDLPELGAN